jgi:hypothetical protein
MARAAVTRRADLTEEIIARTMIELAKVGQRDVDVLCEAALNAPARVKKDDNVITQKDGTT